MFVYIFMSVISNFVESGSKKYKNYIKNMNNKKYLSCSKQLKLKKQPNKLRKN